MHPQALILLALCLPLLAHAQAAPANPPPTPIIIDVGTDSQGGRGAFVNGRPYDLPGIRERLKDWLEKFGRTDPVLIRLTDIKDFTLAATIAVMASETHDSVGFYIPALNPERPGISLRFRPQLSPVVDPQDMPDLVPSAPIIVGLTETHQDSVLFHGRYLSIAETEALLRQKASKFGPDDPVILVVSDQIPADAALAWLERARKICRNVWTIPRSSAPEGPASPFAPKPIDDYHMACLLLMAFEQATAAKFPPTDPGTLPSVIPSRLDLTIPPPQELIDRVQRHVQSERGKSKSDEVAAGSPSTAAASPTTTIRNLSGIAVALIIDPNTDKPAIHRVLPGGPAEKVGLRANDSIFKVDGMDVAGLGSESVVPLLRGDPGTTVKVTVLREGVADPLSFTITREVVRLPDASPPATGSGDYLLELQWNIRTLEASLSKAIADGLGEQHPDIKALRAKLDALEKECAKFLKQAPEPDSSPQPTPTNQQP